MFKFLSSATFPCNLIELILLRDSTFNVYMNTKVILSLTCMYVH